MNDEKWMGRAIAIAEEGRVAPNPRVGALLVQDDVVIGEGFHQFYGGPHAERNAIDDAAQKSGRQRFPKASLYCTLEPCCYRDEAKHQPPCTEAILKAGIRRVVIAHRDPNPRVEGGGIEILRKKGIRVETGCRAQEAQAMNPEFITRMLSGRPFVQVKLAQSLDGRIASRIGNSRWISNEKSRQRVHGLRAACDAIMVGAGTVRADNPRLNVRLVEGPDPQIIVPDSTLSTPLTSHLLKPGTLIFHGADVSPQRLHQFRAKGVELLCCPQAVGEAAGEAVGELASEAVGEVAGELAGEAVGEAVGEAAGEAVGEVAGELSLKWMLRELGRRQIGSLLVEGGARLVTSFIKERFFDKLFLFIAPIIIGRGIEGIGDLQVEQLKNARVLINVHWEAIDDQMLFSGWNKEAPCLREL